MRSFLREYWLTIVVVAALAVGYLLLRTPSNVGASAAELSVALEQGQPCVIEFYSNT